MEPDRDGATFGMLLRRHRLAAGLSQEALAERARMSTIGVGALERGDRRVPRRETVAFLAAALSLDAGERAAFETAAARRTSAPGSARFRDDGSRGAAALPLALKPLVGRGADIDVILAYLQSARLVTITGAGGIGKTSVALEAGAATSERLGAASCLVELAALRDGSLVAATVARAFGLQKHPNRPLLETLLAYLERQSLVLLLDNCEHVVDEAASLADAILRRCPAVRILATSREALRVAGERIYRLPSLAVPAWDAARGLRANDVRAYGAIALFIERARSVDAGFALDDTNAGTVAEICRRLDGIPLAIELAATRVTVLSVDALLEKLDRRLEILGGGDRTALPRHRTMRALIDWSYDLLSSNEQRLFESLSIFAGGCVLETAAAAYGAPELRDGDASEACVFELLASLVDKSLAVADLAGSESRYRLLETAREYAREKLVARGAVDAVARRHADASLARAEALERTYASDSDRVWRASAQSEIENWRAALVWTLVERRDVVAGQRLVGALLHVWNEVATVEGRRFAAMALDLIDDRTPPNVVAKLYVTESYAALSFCEHAAALAAAERALECYEQLGDPLGVAWSDYLAGLPLLALGRAAEGEARLHRALAAARGRGDRRLMAGVLGYIAYAHVQRGDFERGRVAYAEARAIYQAFGADARVARTLADVAELEFRARDAETALRFATDAVATLRERNAGVDVTTLINMSAYLVSLHRYDEANARASEALTLGRARQRDAVVAFALQHLGAIAALRPQVTSGDLRAARVRAARILGYVDARLSSLEHAPRAYTEHQEYERTVGVLSEMMGPKALGDLMAAGARFTEDQAIAEALSV